MRSSKSGKVEVEMRRIFRGVLPVIRRDESSKEIKPIMLGAYRLEVHGENEGMQQHFKFTVGVNSADITGIEATSESIGDMIQRFLEDAVFACEMADKQVEMGHKYFPDHRFILVPEEEE